MTQAHQTARLVIATLIVIATAAFPAPNDDPDGDGLTNRQEEILGTDPSRADKFQVIMEDRPESVAARAKPTYDPTKDVLKVEFAHAGGDRYLFRATMAAPPRPKETVLHFYVDADANEATGRKGPAKAYSTGTEYMVSQVAGTARVSCYASDGGRLPGKIASYVVQGNAIILSADLDLGRDERGIFFSLYVLCHTATKKPPMSDSVPKRKVSDLPIVPRDKIKRPADLSESQGVDSTFGLDIIRAALKRKDIIVVPREKLELDGAEIDLFTSQRYRHVRMSGGGKVRTAAPKGRYHVGFMMYDGGNDERIIIRINDVVKGVVLSNVDNNRTWIYWLKDAQEFKGGERVELQAAGRSGKHGVCNIMFLPEPLPVRKFEYSIQHMSLYAPPESPGRVIVSWITPWPCPTRFEYGTTKTYGQTAVAKKPMLVHRVVLEGIAPGQTYYGRAVGTTRDGKPYYSKPIPFDAIAGRGPAPQTIAGIHRVPLTVRNPHPFGVTNWPITSGIPFPQGQLASAAEVRLTREGEEVPAQVEATGRWRDGSIKWILVTFQADAPASGQSVYTLEYGRGLKRRDVPGGVKYASTNGRLSIDTGALRVSIDARGQIVLPSGKACLTEMVDSKGRRYLSSGGKAQVTVEERGPIRWVARIDSSLESDGKEGPVQIQKRVMAYRGEPFLRVQHTFTVAGSQPYTEIEQLSLTVPSRSKTWQVPLAEGKSRRLDAAAPRLWQRTDRELLSGAAAANARMVGACLSSSPNNLAVAVRDGWQNYPKGFALTKQGLRVELCPDFEPGFYDTFPFEKEGHHLYYYLLNGRYKFKRGMSKTHELLLCVADEPKRSQVCALFQRPLLATAPPEWYCRSRAFYDVAVRDEKRFKAYEEAIDSNIKRYALARERQHDYGLMNYGDWYGERGANWGNIEYDTQHALLLEYIRSGNEAAFFLADQTERHNRDIDTIHWSPDGSLDGAVYVHQMGHVGGYYTKSVPGTLGIPRAGYTVSHAWAEGHFNHYFLTGDRRSFETGKAVVDFFSHKMLGRPYDFTSCRVPGWHLIMNSIAYAATNDPYYLNASRVIVERVLETQDVEPRPMLEYQREPGRTYQVGGWTRMMVPGHCRCEPRHRGNAGFMVAILLSGLKYYHDVTEDPRVKECIIRGARYLVDECYSDEVHGFRYTSCPNTRYRAGASPLMVEGIARAYRWTREERFKRVLTDALPISARGSAYGKGFSMYYRMAPRVLADMAATGLTLVKQNAPKPLPFKKPDWLAKLKPDELIVVQAEDFVKQGVGICQVRSDRQATWGKMITHWHADVGHWLEWEFSVPRAGRYAVRFRYATASEATVREFRVDGQIPCPTAKRIAFPKTGGYGHSPRDWKYLSLMDESGKEAALPLAAGKHRIRMTNLGDGLGMDFIALVRVSGK